MPFPLPDYLEVVTNASADPRCAYRAPHILLTDYFSRFGRWSELVRLGNCVPTCNAGTVMPVWVGTGWMNGNPICPADAADQKACQPATGYGNGECLVPSAEADLTNGVADGEVCACDRPGPIWRCVSVHQLPVPPLPP